MVSFSSLSSNCSKQWCFKYLKECECNLSGTQSGSSICTENDGDCQCDVVNGYTGTKCDECLEGWWWLHLNQTCMGN